MNDDTIGLVADIGRVSVRFGLTGGARGREPREVRTFLTADHPTFTDALVGYLDAVGQRDAVLPSVLAVAGAARGDLINLTGSRWYISLSGVAAVLRHRPIAMNECAANALALTTLHPTDFLRVAGGPVRPVEAGGNFVTIGIGTGLGVAALVTSGGRLVPIQSEAGHMSLATTTTHERDLVAELHRRGQCTSAEALLSAGGLVAAHAMLRGGPAVASSHEVTRNAARDPAAAAAIEMFAGYLGSFVGDLILAYGAWDGVFLTGPIARALHPRLLQPAFRDRICAKDAFRRQLSEVPVAVVNRSDLELVGAAAALTD